MSKPSDDFSVDIGKDTSTLRARNKWIIGVAITAIIAACSIAWADRTDALNKINAATQSAESLTTHVASIDKKIDDMRETQFRNGAKVDLLLEINGYDPVTLQRRKP